MKELQEGVIDIEMQLEKQTSTNRIVPRLELTANNTFVFLPFTNYTAHIMFHFPFRQHLRKELFLTTSDKLNTNRCNMKYSLVILYYSEYKTCYHTYPFYAI
jgi:hypothetical protein